MKGMAALAFGLVAVSCNKSDIFNPSAQQEENEKKSEAAFAENVMDGQAIDANQTWATASPATVNVSVNLDYGEEYSVYLFTEDPNYSTNAKYLGVTTVKSGEKASLTIAKPNDVTALYAACVNKKGNYFAQRFDIEGTTANVNIGSSNAQQNIARRAATTVNGVNVNADSYKRTKNEFINDIEGYNNDWAGYYDLSKVDAENVLNLQLYTPANNYQGGPAYGNNLQFILPAGKSFTLKSLHLTNMWDATVIVVKGTLTIDSMDELRLFGDGATSTQYAKAADGSALGKTFTHGQTIIIDGGTVICNAKKLTVANKSNIINIGGTLQLNGTYVDYANGADKGFCNFGTITGTNGAGINFAGGTPYYNNGSIDLTNNGYIKFNGDIEFVNTGHIHAYNADASATTVNNSELARGGQNAKVVNLCDMTFTKFFSVHTYIGTSNSLLYAQGGLYVNNGGRITLGSQAMIKCGDWYDNGGQVAASTNANEYAIFQVTGDIDEQTGQDTKATGYAYFDIAGIIKGKGSSDQSDYHVVNFKKNMLNYTVSEATAPANITIASEENGCNYIGYHEGDGDKTFTPNYIYYAFEDLGTTNDFDFNDVVIRVSTPNAQGKSTVELMCAGGTMSTVVTYGTGAAARNLGSEVHEALGASSYKAMVNTGSGETKPFPVTLGTIEGLTAQTDMTNLPFGITCQGNNGQVFRVERSVAGHGKAPLVIVVSGDENGKWYWPTEFTNISIAYPGFGAWGADVESNTDWYKNAAGSVYAW